MGHSVDKVEFILMGGTFMSLPMDYRDYFVRNLHDALSGHSSKNVTEAVRFSEQSATRCIGMTIETRPDFCLTPHLSAMLSYGCTRLEIGLQSTYEDVARDTNRGHTVAAVGECFELAKNAGFKVVAHLMVRGLTPSISLCLYPCLLLAHCCAHLIARLAQCRLGARHRVISRVL